MAAININKENFQNLVMESDRKVLLDFWAPWCGPCRMVAPIVEEIVEENEELKLGKINVDEQRELAIQFKITSIPTLVLMRGGETAATVVGYRSKGEILKKLGL